MRGLCADADTDGEAVSGAFCAGIAADAASQKTAQRILNTPRRGLTARGEITPQEYQQAATETRSWARKKPDAALADRCRDRGAVVAGSIVYDDDFNIRQILVQDALQGLAEILRAVSHRNDHAHCRQWDFPCDNRPRPDGR